MTPDNLWPSVGRLLQASYIERRRAWIERNRDRIAPWPKRRTNTRKPIPGVYDLAVEDNG